MKAQDSSEGTGRGTQEGVAVVAARPRSQVDCECIRYSTVIASTNGADSV